MQNNNDQPISNILPKQTDYRLWLNRIAHAYGGSQDPECKRVMARLMADNNMFKPTEVLWRHHMITRKQTTTEKLSRKQMVDELQRSSEHYFFQGSLEGAYFIRKAIITRTDHNYFNYFFSYICSRVGVDNFPGSLEEFLYYHLTYSFSSDIKQYKLFLLQCFCDYTTLEKRKLFIEAWLDQNESMTNNSSVDEPSSDNATHGKRRKNSINENERIKDILVDDAKHITAWITRKYKDKSIKSLRRDCAILYKALVELKLIDDNFSKFHRAIVNDSILPKTVSQQTMDSHKQKLYNGHKEVENVKKIILDEVGKADRKVKNI
jgi:hypothetical protein